MSILSGTASQQEGHVPHPSRPTVTLHDVARAAGVSLATASRVLGGSDRRVAQEYERRVLAAAAELNYTPDLAARAMRGRTDTVALVADDLATPSMGVVVAAMEREARTVGAFVSVAQTRGVAERQFATVRMLCSFRPRALVLTSARMASTATDQRLIEELRAYQRNGGRVVLYGSIDLPFDTIRIDEIGSARLVGLHLAATGHRRILLLAGTPDRSYAAFRTRGFVEGLRSGGVLPADIRTLPCEVSRAGGFTAIAQLLTGTPAALHDIDAIVAVNDAVAIGAMSACRAAGLRIPADLSITGFDDIPLAADVTPRLATLALPHAEIGTRAVRLALSPTAPHDPPLREVITGSFLPRASSAARPAP
ncbi:LacI family DNA-binding transcriptional regulator [Actinoplanes sp. NPDC051851]|uniref:LacI family DNA-binding transcriptional regulator n=1 Tax=Actinoplanes sp. NPDC051851 TaxID=3154753 RepID=UPI00343A903A